MTYYKYAERDEASRVDWNAISKTYSETIQKGLETREKKRQAIELATTLLTQEIIAQPEGTHRGVQEFYSEYSTDAQELLLDANRRLKNGEYAVRDYMALMANMTTDVQTITSLGQYYMDNHKDISQRWENGESQEFEIKLGETFQDHTNFTDTGVKFDPVTGKARIVKRKLNQETGLFEYGEPLTPAELRAAMGTRYDKYDADSAATKIANEMGRIQKKIGTGGIRTREGQSEMEYIDERLKQQVEASLENGLHVSSILTMDMEGYEVSFNAKTAGENDVLGVLNPLQPSAGEKVPLIGVIEQIESLEAAEQEQKLDEIFGADLSKEERAALIEYARNQKDSAREWMDTEVRTRFDMIEQPMTSTGGGGGGGGRGEKRKLGEKNLDALEDIYKGDDATVQRGLEYVFGLDENYRSGDVKTNANNERVLMLTYYDTKEKKLFTREIPIGDSLSGWVESASTQFFDDEQRGYINDAFGKLPKDRKGAAPGSGIGHAERTLQEEVAGYDSEVKGFDSTGKLIDVTPRSSYIAETGEKGGNKPERVSTSAANALSAMGFEDAQVRVVNLDPDGLGNSTDAVMYYVPEVMDYQVFVPEKNNVNVVNRLNEMVSDARDKGEKLTVEQLQDAIGINDYDLYNTQYFRNANPVEQVTIDNPDATKKGELD